MIIVNAPFYLYKLDVSNFLAPVKILKNTKLLYVQSVLGKHICILNIT